MNEVNYATAASSRAHFEGSIEFLPLDIYAPTPLDPYNNFVEATTPYASVAAIGLEARASQFRDNFGLPYEVYKRGLDELIEAHEVRCRRNDTSLARLLNAVDWSAADAELLGIIQKARQANADPQELLRLIKEYPDMISIEFFKSHPLFDVAKSEDIRRQLMGKLVLLQQTFRDAEIVFNYTTDNTNTAKFETTGNGIIVLKQQFGQALSEDSQTDIVVKQSMIAVPETTMLPVRALRSKIASQQFHVLPLGVSAYFRAADYQDRIQS